MSNKNLHKLEMALSTITEYHRWLAEFPAVTRVLENLYMRIDGKPMLGAEHDQFRSVSHLRDELRAMTQAKKPKSSKATA
jgi:hypothetical protein